MDYLKEHTLSTDMQDFTNDLYACVLEHGVGEDLTDLQMAFYKEHLGNRKRSTYEWAIIGKVAMLLMEWTAIYGSRVDFEEFVDCEQIDFTGISEWMDFFPEVCTDLTNTSCPSNGATARL